MKVLIQTFNNAEYKIECHSGDLVRELKEKIYDKVNIDPENQVLQFMGRILKDDKTLDFYNVTSEAIILLVQQVTLSILVQIVAGRTIKIDCKSDDTIAKVKEKINRKANIDPETQILNFATKELADNNTLAHYEIQEGSIIHLTMRLPGGYNDRYSPGSWLR